MTTDPVVAAAALRRGGLAALPTETVYGLAADATDDTAVNRIYRIKGRPADHPLIVHVARADELTRWAREIPSAAATLAEACWPGPLTLLVRRSRSVLDSVTGGRDTVGVRVPAHPLATEVLGLVGAVAAPSANLFGRVSPTTADHVLADLGPALDPGRDVILDGGACPVGVESTIVDCTVDPPQVLRPGGIPTEDVIRLLGGRLGAATGPSRASGMLASHYAPRCRVFLAESVSALQELVDEARSTGATVGVLDDTHDLVAYARDLYGSLRAADESGVDVIVALLPPAAGLGHAIRDRLTKAAAVRG